MRIRSSIVSRNPPGTSSPGGRTSNRRRRSASSVSFSSDCASLRSAAESPLGSRRRWSCSSTAVSFCSASSCRSPANRLRALSTAVETFLSSICRAASTFSSRSAVRFKSRSAYFSCQTSPAASPAFCKTHVSSRENPSTRRESYAATWPRRWSPARQGTATAFLTPSVSRYREQGVNRGLVRPLDTLGAHRPLFVDQPLPLAAVKVRPQVDQRVDHGLTALAQLRDGDRCRDLVREDRERLLLHLRVAAWARDTDHAERAAGDLERLGARRAARRRADASHPIPGRVRRGC